MRILISGLIVFIGWAVFSTYIYVCKVKGLCGQSQAVLVEVVDKNYRPKAIQVAIQNSVSPTELIIYFDFDKSDFIYAVKAIEFVESSNELLINNAQAKLCIIGHTDEVGTLDYNKALGFRRAETMQRYFVRKGIPSSKITIESKGEENPAANNNSEKGRANNRRTVIIIK